MKVTLYHSAADQDVWSSARAVHGRSLSSFVTRSIRLALRADRVSLHLQSGFSESDHQTLVQLQNIQEELEEIRDRIVRQRRPS